MADAAEIREKINKLGTDMKALVIKAREEKREMTTDENTAFDRMDAEREPLIVEEKRMLRIAELEGSSRRTDPRMGDGGHEQRGGKPQITNDDRLEALRSWLQAGSDIPLTQEQRATCERMNINPLAKRHFLALPSLAPRSLRDPDFESWERRAYKQSSEKRALSTLTSTSPEDGSYLIANEAMGSLERAMLAFGGMRQASSVKRTTKGGAWPIPMNDDTSNKGALLAENTITVDKDPAFQQLVLNAYKFTSKKVRVSRELLQDSNENLAAVLGDMLGERIGRIQNDYFTTGTGTGEPKGIVTAATSSGIALSAKTPTYAEVVSIEHAVDPAYRNGGGWMFHDTMFAEYKKIVDASTGRPIWLPNMIAGAPDTILGYPYYINQSMAVASATGSGKSILFGNLKKYIIREVKDIELFRLDELYAEYYQVAFVAFSRADGDLLDAGTHPVVYAANHA